jgi:uncharacterized protein YbaR (Trm112 family)
VDPRLLEILACPICKGALRHDRNGQALICDVDRLAYPIRDGIPIMMVDQARHLDPADPHEGASPASTVEADPGACPASKASPAPKATLSAGARQLQDPQG